MESSGETALALLRRGEVTGEIEAHSGHGLASPCTVHAPSSEAGDRCHLLCQLVMWLLSLPSLRLRVSQFPSYPGQGGREAPLCSSQLGRLGWWEGKLISQGHTAPVSHLLPSKSRYKHLPVEKDSQHKPIARKTGVRSIHNVKPFLCPAKGCC